MICDVHLIFDDSTSMLGGELRISYSFRNVDLYHKKNTDLLMWIYHNLASVNVDNGCYWCNIYVYYDVTEYQRWLEQKVYLQYVTPLLLRRI